MGFSGTKVDAFLIDAESLFWAYGTKEDAFLVEVNPFELTSLTPDYGRAGDTVVLAGTGFGAAQGGSTVKFGLLTATVTAWSATEITVTVPAITGDCNVTVVLP